MQIRLAETGVELLRYFVANRGLLLSGQYGSVLPQFLVNLNRDLDNQSKSREVPIIVLGQCLGISGCVVRDTSSPG